MAINILVWIKANWQIDLKNFFSDIKSDIFIIYIFSLKKNSYCISN